MQTTLSNYRILFDRQADGFMASTGSVSYYDGRLTLVFLYASDAARGLPQYRVDSDDLGRTWSEPVPFGPPLSNPQEQHQTVCLVGRTSRGTLIGCGFFLPVGIREDAEHYEQDIAWRPNEALIGRQEAGARDMTWTRYPSGTFAGEQFVERGLITRSGRIVLPVWGAATRGANWQCGVLLSDDDGVSWIYRPVGVEPDPAIRAKPDRPAGFNEQSLFELPSGTLVSMMRGREHLGATDDVLDETWFFRSESRDGGETWSRPEPTRLAGTGAGMPGLVLPDGSLIHAARVPLRAASLGHVLPEPDLYGLVLSRSFDDGRTWRTEHLLQRDPLGGPFDNYYNAMNGQWAPLGDRRWLYVFGHFDHPRNRHRMLCFEMTCDE